MVATKEIVSNVALGLVILGASTSACIPTALIVVDAMELGLLRAWLLAGRLLSLMQIAKILRLHQVLWEHEGVLLGSLGDRLMATHISV